MMPEAERREKMTRWFLVENNLHQKKALVAARVPVTEITIAKPRAIQGIAFPEEERERVLEILGLANTPLNETETDREGVFLLAVRTATVSVADWDGKNQSGFARTAQEVLVPVVGDIVLSVPHRGTVAPASDEKFHIFIWSAPAGQAESRPPEKIWGIKVDCRDEGFLPSGQGVAIVDSETGWAVGELVGNNLFIHHDLCHHGTDREIQIFRRLCEEVVAEFTLSPEKKRERQRQISERERQRSREAYVRECGRRLQSTIEATRKSIEEARRTIRDCQKQITQAVRSEAGLRKKLEELLSSSASAEKQFADEFDKLLQAPGVSSVRVADGVVQVFTDQVYIEYDGRTYDIGKFRLDIYTSGGNGGVRAFNLSRKSAGFHHPHIDGDGECCFGNIADGVAKLIGEYQYSVLVQVMVQFLRSVNPDGWYTSIEGWPVVKPAEEVKE